jgi:hypothetical protein
MPRHNYSGWDCLVELDEAIALLKGEAEIGVKAKGASISKPRVYDNNERAIELE